ncbi:phenylacetate--CoA ligase family protein [uncultured Algibacter sp.]|uniref:phenylacetate--CoA ligase family protein n=1 Tax=uncultured Algibacter sp. TaxID=298659 RepID=UPI0026350A4B|nr:phenylacetate--CoA ligase family protein [uncultured Algibacter sp.]
MNLFDFSLQLNGFPIKEASGVLKTIHKINDSDYLAYINSKKNDIVKFHLENNIFYKSFTNNIDVSNWNSVPIMTKKDLQKPLQERLSKGFSKNTIYINKTSGSSGHPFIFAKDKFSHALTWAIIQNRFGWYNINFNSSKQARFYGIPLDKKGYYKERFKDKISGRFRFSVFDLSDRTFEKHLEKFKSTSFNYINGYTSAIVQFAKFLKKKNCVLKDVCPSLNACVVTSEMLFKADKKLLETQFNVPVINEYGASELDLIAFENPNGNWQVNSETLFVEILDENNNVLPYGEEGRIVITSLYNKAHPFIRYDIGDVGTLSKASTLKTPILEKLVGRTNDVVILPSGKKAAGLTFYYITKSIIEDDGNVKEFVIKQLKPNTFKIIYVSSEILSKEKIKTINTEIENYLEKGLIVEFEKQDQLLRSKSGKLKQFSSYLNQNT